ncbi:uncharacterized protein LOC126473663 [Schistocerca serialis cubense]|uniref:uncharacterized protein LOC126473663 n=1 Tax=Schistocerca serialis cubense TaxID=2023355 RepID=UPI00214F2521|nr:uncharacterized protein LOC126473663 [Schistocerca serialis cubense]
MSFHALPQSFRMGLTTFAQRVHETCATICEILSPVHLPSPTIPLLQTAAKHMYANWNFRNCVGAIDGKHIRVKCPPHSGTMSYNYKKYFSPALLAVANAKCRLIAVDIGGYGKQSDGGTFRASNLYNNILNETENWPPPKELPGTSVKSPLVLVGDEAFPLLEKLNAPFPWAVTD